MALFDYGEIQLSHSVGKYKIDCDHLTESDYLALANIVVDQIDFYEAWGVPTGGCAFANALNFVNGQRGIPDTVEILVVDDVLTTGNSMYNWILKEMNFEPWITANEAAQAVGFKMLVIFDRNQLLVPDMTVQSIFKYNLQDQNR